MSIRNLAWVAGIACLWGVLVAIIGVGGAWTSYVVAYSTRIPSLLSSLQDIPLLLAATVFAAALIVALPMRFLGAPTAAWLGIPLGEALLFAVVWAMSFVNGAATWDAFVLFLRSDLAVALLVVSAAFAASRIIVRQQQCA